MTTYMKTLPLLLCLFGCNYSEGIPVEVKVPVVTSCNFAIPPQPVYLSPDAVTADPVTMLKAVLADNELRKGYIAQLLAAMESCNDNGHLASPAYPKSAAKGVLY
jgi:hypothetical protein